MKNFKYIAILFVFLFSCKSTKTATNNQLDISKEVVAKKENTIRVNQLTLDEFEITFHTADPKQEVVITDEKGNTKKFQNIKKATLKKKTEQKKDSVIKDYLTTEIKEKDNSIIKVDTESVSDAKNFKGIAIAGSIGIFFIFLIVVLLKFKK